MDNVKEKKKELPLQEQLHLSTYDDLTQPLTPHDARKLPASKCLNLSYYYLCSCFKHIWNVCDMDKTTDNYFR